MENAAPSPMTETHRSFELFDQSDFDRLIELARVWLEDIALRLPATCGAYAEQVLMTCLAQGGARHYVDQHNGVKDLDVWTFFRARTERAFPSRTVWNRDFGQSRFGKHPDDIGYTGRRVDLIGRSIPCADDEQPTAAVRRWLEGSSASAFELRKAPVLALVHGKKPVVIWKPHTPSGAGQK
jgi:hypothetical protein